MQEMKANRAIKDVETNQQVSWQEIRRGCRYLNIPNLVRASEFLVPYWRLEIQTGKHVYQRLRFSCQT